MIRTRFAPSPTGYLHIGGVRTALFNWLYARQKGGQFLLRLEDTDATRNTPEAIAAIYEGLRWLGLDWDEGPEKGGPHGPYCQSERGAIYDEWFEKLLAADRVYQEDGAWRFRFKRQVVTLSDQICGEVAFDFQAQAAISPDMTLKRPDGSYIFHFTNVVDDLTMGITHVLRAEDHLSNTHKHLQLIEALGEPPPVYAHAPLILNGDGSKMSKRDTGAALKDYIEEGFLPAAVLNFTALLGWSPKDDSELLTLPELTERFSLAAISRSGAKCDLEKARWMNGEYLKALSPEALAEKAAHAFDRAGLPQGDRVLVAKLVQEKIRTFRDLKDWLPFFTEDAPPLSEPAHQKAFRKEGASALAQGIRQTLVDCADWTAPGLKAALATFAEAQGLKIGKVMFPTRVLTTGADHGPDLLPLLEYLGQARTVKRAEHILSTSAGLSSTS
ncbi:MAG: glutamate--tRNA ligase family protein [Verrucomicrobiota bacterium]